MQRSVGTNVDDDFAMFGRIDPPLTFCATGPDYIHSADIVVFVVSVECQRMRFAPSPDCWINKCVACDAVDRVRIAHEANITWKVCFRRQQEHGQFPEIPFLGSWRLAARLVALISE